VHNGQQKPNVRHKKEGAKWIGTTTPYHNSFTALFRDHPGEPVPKDNFWTLWCKERLTEADILTIRLGATPSGPTSAHLHLLKIVSPGTHIKSCRERVSDWKLQR